MNITVKIEAVELAEAINKLAEAIAGRTEEVKPKSPSRKKKEQSATEPQPQPQQTTPEPQPEPQTVQQPSTTQPQCGDCNAYTPDTALNSVGKCDNPAATATVNGFVPTAQPACNEYQTPIQSTPTTPPVQQTIIPTAPPVQQQPVQQPQITPQPVPTQTPTYKLSDIQLAAQQLMDAGKQQELRNLLTSFGVQALVKLPPEQYANFAAQLRAMGARI